MQIGRNGGPLQKAIPRDDAEPALQRTPLIPFASISFVFSARDRGTPITSCVSKSRLCVEKGKEETAARDCYLRY